MALWVWIIDSEDDLSGSIVKFFNYGWINRGDQGDHGGSLEPIRFIVLMEIWLWNGMGRRIRSRWWMVNRGMFLWIDCVTQRSCFGFICSCSDIGGYVGTILDEWMDAWMDRFDSLQWWRNEFWNGLEEDNWMNAGYAILSLDWPSFTRCGLVNDLGAVASLISQTVHTTIHWETFWSSTILSQMTPRDPKEYPVRTLKD